MVNVERRIKRIRRLMLVHSYLYYHLDAPVVTDEYWQTKANLLKELQTTLGTKFNFYDEAFADWDGSTGCHLPVDDWVIMTAQKILDYLELYGGCNELPPSYR